MVTANFNSVKRSEDTTATVVTVNQSRQQEWAATDNARATRQASDQGSSPDSSGPANARLVTVVASSSSLTRILSWLTEHSVEQNVEEHVGQYAEHRVQVCDSWDQAVAEFLAGQGGCVLMDIDVETERKLDRVRQSRCQWDLLTVVACSAQDNGAAAMAAAAAGCQEFVCIGHGAVESDGHHTPDVIEEARRKIQSVCARDTDGEYCRQQFRTRWKTLSLRERDVLRRCLDGENSKSLAKQLTVTYQTIDKHRNRALRKMNCNSLIEFATLLHQLQSIAD